ncbi:MAG: 4'-phosphopantetheinyl transferase superfamily protein [Muribaculaceae bacterium]|jgi:phosphopantetheinyl transferase (holo-ACP synthase)
MEDEFIYWPHPTPVGIKVEEISGMESKSGAIWRELAMQIYCENGRDGFREIGHFPNGAPFLFGMTARISITHTGHLLAVATLPKTPESNLASFAQRTAMGIDAERLDREQVIKVRDKFLSDAEKEFVAADNLEANIIAWTAKEALYKAAMTSGLDFKDAIKITSLPKIDRQMNLPGAPAPVIGTAVISIPMEEGDAMDVDMNLYSYESEGHCVTIAFSPKCAKFGRH